MNKIKWCCDKIIKPLYPDIVYKDYWEPIKRLSKEYNNIFEDVIKQNDINDLQMQYYIKSSTNISIIVITPQALRHKNALSDAIALLKANGDIHYTKDINLSYYGVLNLIYQLYAHEYRMKKITDIMYKATRIGFKNDGLKRMLKIIVYTHNNIDKPINGSSAIFKQELRHLFVKEDIKETQFEANDDRYPRGYDYLHVSDKTNQAYEYSGIFFNENSLKFLERQQCWRMLDMKRSNENYNYLKNFIYDYSQMEVEKLLIYSSGILYTHGVREANDIDCMLLESDKIPPNLVEMMNSSIDISYKGTKSYNIEWENELRARAKLIGAIDFTEQVINPKYYYYFMGIKVLRLMYEIRIRFRRMRPAQFTDLIIMRQMFNLNYELKIPDRHNIFDIHKQKNVSIITDKDKYIKTVQCYLKTRYYINLSIEYIEKWIKMSYIENKDNDISVQSAGGVDEMFNKLENIADKKYIYPTQEELITMGYSPNIIIYSSDKPYLYPGENFTNDTVKQFCNNIVSKLKYHSKRYLRVATFNLHNFVSRCNTGLAPLFGSALNPFHNSRDIQKFIDLFIKIDADILCLQDLVPVLNKTITKDLTDLKYIRENFNFEYFNKLMAKIGYVYKVIGATQQGHFFDTEDRNYYFLANGIYSKIKLENEEIYGYKYLNRNIIKASVVFNNKTIDIYNVHMEYFMTNNKILKDMGITIDQVSQTFIDLIELVKNNSTNPILCGDFNIDLYKTHSTHKRYNNINVKTKYFKENFKSISIVNIPTNFSQNDKTDFILIKNNIKTVYSYTETTNISDHYVVIGDFI